MTPIVIGLVGYGKIARDQHARVLAEHTGFRLAAVADIAESHPDLPSFPDISSMLAAHPDITAVSLCMPPRFRAEAAEEAIAAGRHVLMEKPPCATLEEAQAVERLASQAGVTLFTAWHSQQAAGVSAAREWLADRSIRSVQVAWREDVRVWHPGQAWIWQEGGFGVFDPGINALSILTEIVPGRLRVTGSELAVPANCVTPIAASLALESDAGFHGTAEFDFRQTGLQTWNIEVSTSEGTLCLSLGGNELRIDGRIVPLGAEGEYPALYDRFAELIRTSTSEVHLCPLRLVEEAFDKGRFIPVEPFVEGL